MIPSYQDFYGMKLVEFVATLLSLRFVFTSPGRILENIQSCCSPRNLWKRCAKIAVQQRYACHTGNMGLAKLCYRRGAVLSAKTQKGETAFNIVTQNKRYDALPQLDRPSQGSQKTCVLAQAPPKKERSVQSIWRLLMYTDSIVECLYIHGGWTKFEPNSSMFIHQFAM